MKRRPPKTLTEVAYLNLRNQGIGPLAAINRAADAIATIGALALARRDFDHWPTQVEYATFWKVSERTAQREWARVKEAFPGEDGPERLARHVYAELGDRLDNLGTVQTVDYLAPVAA